MKVIKKLLLLGLAIAMLVATSIPAFALPGNTVVVGDKAFSMDYFFDASLNAEIIAAINAGGDIYYDPTSTGDSFKDAFSGADMTPAQRDARNGISYLNHDGTRVTYADFDNKIADTTELTIKAGTTPTAVNATTVSVTFSDNVIRELPVSPDLTAGTNTRTVTFNGVSYIINVSYIPPVPTKPALESISFVNYRNIKVTFNSIVDNESATDAANYYFDIVDGNAQYGAMPTLQDSNQLSMIETEYIYGADGWWNGVKSSDGTEIAPPHIVANDVSGKTIVDIYFPEDARFTNLEDKDLKGVSGDLDDERTLAIVHNNGTSEFTTPLTKRNTTNMVVRNVRNTAGNTVMDTAFRSITIQEDVAPVLEGIEVVANEDQDVNEDNATAVQSGTVYHLVIGEQDYIAYNYNEPVFDAHELGKAGFTNRDVRLSVDGTMVASQSGKDEKGLTIDTLESYLHFAMSKDDTYAQSKVITLDAKRAILAAGEKYEDGALHSITLVGVTDLAGNIQSPSNVVINVKVHDPVLGPVVIDPTIRPEVLGVKQVGDNVFRVYFNRADAVGKLTIDNSDGEGGRLEGYLVNNLIPGTLNGVACWYGDVEVPAVDTERVDINGFDNLVTDPDNVLAYDGQRYIERSVRVVDVNINAGNLAGNSTSFERMKIEKDLLPPILDSASDISYNKEARNINGSTTKLAIAMKDQYPWSDGVANDVNALTYSYSYTTKIMSINEIINFIQGGKIVPTLTSNYRPIEVSYVDANGATHMATVSNVELLDTALPSGVNTSNITYDDASNILNIDLKNYAQLLDSKGNLVEGATYTVGIPHGFFSDNARDYYRDSKLLPWHHVSRALFVDDGRKKDAVILSWTRPFIKEYEGVGFVNQPIQTGIYVQTAPPVEPPVEDDAVPQTSVELIKYNRDTNEVQVEFTGQINTTTLKNPENYIFNGHPLSFWGVTSSGITYKEDNSNPNNVRKFAIFKVPADSVAVDGDVPFRVMGVQNNYQGTMTPVNTVINVLDNTRPVCLSAVKQGENQVVLTFDERIMYLVNDTIVGDETSSRENFVVRIGGTRQDVVKAVINDSLRTLTLTVSDTIGAGDITVQIVKNSSAPNILIVDKNRNPINNDSTILVTR